MRRGDYIGIDRVGGKLNWRRVSRPWTIAMSFLVVCSQQHQPDGPERPERGSDRQRHTCRQQTTLWGEILGKGRAEVKE
ncbi:hypothetical protein V496_09400 [Pseudogymnoascus sp. VKM F-4515 (FW-2607)]|nr:hypothetical protein V496_09400 [Pseudogymnoascus sp. VKM F-4515 (FW-2607)]